MPVSKIPVPHCATSDVLKTLHLATARSLDKEGRQIFYFLFSHHFQLHGCCLNEDVCMMSG